MKSTFVKSSWYLENKIIFLNCCETIGFSIVFKFNHLNCFKTRFSTCRFFWIPTSHCYTNKIVRVFTLYGNSIDKFRPYILRSVPRVSRLQKFKDEYFEELVWMVPEIAESLKKKNNTHANGAFPQFKGLLKYINVRDYQLFAKRLRKYLSKK